MKTKISLLLLFVVIGLSSADLFKGFKGYDKGYDKGKGYHDYGHDVLVVHKPVIRKKPVLTYQPEVHYQPVYIRKPRPPPPAPIVVHKPVITNHQQWQLISKPSVSYKPVVIHPGHGYGGHHKGYGHPVATGYGHPVAPGYGHDVSHGYGVPVAHGYGHGVAPGYGHGVAPGYGHTSYGYPGYGYGTAVLGKSKGKGFFKG